MQGGAAADPWLSDRGRAEAQAVVRALAGEAVDAVYSSPRRRALETIEPLCAQRGLTAAIVEGVAEFDKHTGEYLFFDDLRRAGDPRYRACMRGDLTAWGTDFPTFRDEVVAAVREIAEAASGRRVVVSMHGGSINVLLGAVLDLDRMWFVYPAHGSVSRVAFDHHRGRMRIVSINETAHLRQIDGASADELGAGSQARGSQKKL